MKPLSVGSRSLYKATQRDRFAVWLANMVLKIFGTKEYRNGLSKWLADGVKYKEEMNARDGRSVDRVHGTVEPPHELRGQEGAPFPW